MMKIVELLNNAKCIAKGTNAFFSSTSQCLALNPSPAAATTPAATATDAFGCAYHF